MLAEIGEVFASTLEYDETLRNVATLVVRDLADVCIIETVDDGPLLNRLTVACRDPGKRPIVDDLARAEFYPRHSHLGSEVLETKQPLLMPDVPTDYVNAIAGSIEYQRALRELEPKSLIAVPLLAHGQVGGVLVLLSTNQEHRFGQNDLALVCELARRAALAVENARLYRLARQAIQARDDVLGIA